MIGLHRYDSPISGSRILCNSLTWVDNQDAVIAIRCEKFFGKA